MTPKAVSPRTESNLIIDTSNHKWEVIEKTKKSVIIDEEKNEDQDTRERAWKKSVSEKPERWGRSTGDGHV